MLSTQDAARVGMPPVVTAPEVDGVLVAKADITATLPEVSIDLSKEGGAQ